MANTVWGHLAKRYDHPRPRRLLALDGGGIRGVLTLQILAEIERQLATITGKGSEFRLCHFFDYIAGTSTGAIIAAGLARGMTTAELTDFYEKIGPDMFQKDHLLKRLRHFYKSDPLADKLKTVYGAATTLAPEDLKCLLLVVTRNVTTDSAWPISSNPAAKYNDRARADCNLQIPLWRLVRASTAAPIYFPPEVIEWEKDNPDKAFVFVDGGVTPYNNPAFLLYRMATAPAYRLEWPTGEDKLMLVSVGTGSSVVPGATSLSPEQNMASTLVDLPGALMNGASVDQDMSCRTVGRCVHGGLIDLEAEDMIEHQPLETNLGRRFLYARYDAELTAKGLSRLGLTDIDPEAIGKLDAVSHIDDLSAIGKAAARAVDLKGQFGRLVTEHG